MLFFGREGALIARTRGTPSRREKGRQGKVAYSRMYKGIHGMMMGLNLRNPPPDEDVAKAMVK